MVVGLASRRLGAAHLPSAPGMPLRWKRRRGRKPGKPDAYIAMHGRSTADHRCFARAAACITHVPASSLARRTGRSLRRRSQAKLPWAGRSTVARREARVADAGAAGHAHAGAGFPAREFTDLRLFRGGRVAGRAEAEACGLTNARSRSRMLPGSTRGSSTFDHGLAAIHDQAGPAGARASTGAQAGGTFMRSDIARRARWARNRPQARPGNLHDILRTHDGLTRNDGEGLGRVGRSSGRARGSTRRFHSVGSSASPGHRHTITSPRRGECGGRRVE